MYLLASLLLSFFFYFVIFSRPQHASDLWMKKKWRVHQMVNSHSLYRWQNIMGADWEKNSTESGRYMNEIYGAVMSSAVVFHSARINKSFNRIFRCVFFSSCFVLAAKRGQTTTTFGTCKQNSISPMPIQFCVSLPGRRNHRSQTEWSTERGGCQKWKKKKRSAFSAQEQRTRKEGTCENKIV